MASGDLFWTRVPFVIVYWQREKVVYLVVSAIQLLLCRTCHGGEVLGSPRISCKGHLLAIDPEKGTVLIFEEGFTQSSWKFQLRRSVPRRLRRQKKDRKRGEKQAQRFLHPLSPQRWHNLIQDNLTYSYYILLKKYVVPLHTVFRGLRRRQLK